MSVFGYPATDPLRDFERQSCREIEFEAARLSRLEGRAVDQFGFVARRTVTAQPAVKDGQWRRKERLQIARWSAEARAEWAAKKERERRAALESFEVPTLRELATVCELFPEEAARLFRWRNKQDQE